MKLEMRKVILGAIFLAFFLATPHNANANYDKYILGFNSGYTWWLGIHAGLNLQYYFSSHWGVQLEFYYQTHTYGEDVDGSSFTTYYLNMIYRFTNKKNNFSWYIFAGAGIWRPEPPMIFSKVGTGIKLSFSPRLSLNLGISDWPAPLFIKGVHGFELFPPASRGPEFVSLFVGLEYGF